MPQKFKIGDKVIIARNNDRTSKELLANLRLDHPRTVTAIFYDKKTQHNRYYLGGNSKGLYDLSYVPFRAQELRLWVKGKIGRPRTKRRYRRKLSVSQGVISTIEGRLVGDRTWTATAKAFEEYINSARVVDEKA